MCLERYDDAARAYQQALRLNPGDQAARQYLEMALHKNRRQQGRCLFPRPQPLLHMKRQHRLTAVQRAGGGWLWLGPEHMELLPADRARRSWSVRHDVGLRKVAVSAAADKIVAIEEQPAGVWALDSGLHESTLPNGERHYCLSPDGLYSVAGLVEVRLQHLNDGSCSRPLRGHEKQVLCATFCGGQNRLLTGACDRTARYWDVEKAICLQVLQGHKDFVTCVAYSPETGLALTGSTNGSVKAWRLDTGEFFRDLDEEGQIQSVSFARGGRFAVIQSMPDKDHLTSLWDLRAGQRSRRLHGFSRVSPDGLYLLTSRTVEDRHLLEIREVESGCLRRTLQVEDGPVSDCSFSEDGRFFSVVTLAGSFYLFEFDEAYRILPQELMLTYTRGGQDLEESRERFLGLLRQAETACSQGDYLSARKSLEEARGVPGYRRDPQARVLTRRLGQHLNRGALLSCWERKLMPEAGGLGPTPVLALPGGNRLVTAYEKIVRLWDSQLGNCVRGFPGHSQSIRALAPNEEGSQVVSGSLDRGVRRWDLDTGECSGRVAVSKGGVVALHWLPNSSRVVALTNQYLLSVLDFEQEQEIFQVPVTGLSWMVGARNLVWLGGAIAPGRLQTFDGRTGKLVRRFSSSDASEATLLATAAVTYGEGRYGISAAPDGRVHLWDLTEGRHLGQLLDLQARAAYLAASPDGLCLAIGLEDGSIQVRDLEKRLLCEVIEGPWGKLMGLGLAADSCELFVLGSDQILRIWEIEWELLGQSTRKQLVDTLPKEGILSRLWRGLRG